MPHVEFAYNRTTHLATQFSPFEVVYGFKTLTALGLAPLPIFEHVNLDGKKKAKFVRNLHEKIQMNIEQGTEQYIKQVNKRCHKVMFNLSDWV